MVLVPQNVIHLDYKLIGSLVRSVLHESSGVVVDTAELGSIVCVLGIDLLRHGADAPRGNEVVGKLISRYRIVNHVFLRLDRLSRVVLHHDRIPHPSTLTGRAGERVAVSVRPHRLPQQGAEIALQESRGGNTCASTVEPEIVVRKSLEGAEDEGL